MIRAQLMRNGPESRNGFRLRGTDITRLEGFSDTVFGCAVTLLVFSLQVPTNFADLIAPTQAVIGSRSGARRRELAGALAVQALSEPPSSTPKHTPAADASS